MINIDKINGAYFEELPIIEGAFFKVEEEFNNLFYALNFIESKDYKYEKKDYKYKKKDIKEGWNWFDSIQDVIFFLQLNMIIKKWEE